MTVLIIGHPDSGKSELAEQMVTDMSATGERVYLATMIPYGAEGAARVEKHRKMREGKGFMTIEAPFDIQSALDGIPEAEKKTVLLECLSNLAANEIFERHASSEEVTDKLSDDILQLAAKVNDLIIVSNHFEITPDFDEETVIYAKTMDSLNEALGKVCDKIIEIN